ncbi:MAG: copper resistance protein CopC [Thermoproteota archaeon]|nr:copper resistance protein CopC [Thermoproteota archaeon]
MLHGHRQWYWGIIIGTIIIITFASYGMPESFAHPVYVDSSPRAFQSVPSSPTEVNVFFSEPIELEYSSIEVLGPDGSAVDLNDPHNVEGDTTSMGVTLQPDLPEGAYTVTTSVLSAVDGHVVGETFTFGVGTAVQQQQTGAGGQQQRDILSLEESISRFPGMVGQVIVVGAAFATLWLWKPLARVPWLSSAISKTRVSIDRNMMRLIIIGTGLVLASGAAMIVVQAISINAGIPEAIGTQFGNVWLTRMLQSSILMGIAVAVYRRLAKNKAIPHRAEIYAILILGLAVLVTSGLIAHAAATEQVVPILLDFFHNSAASIWIGGLILLGFVGVPKILSIGDSTIKSAALSILIPRFSTIVVTLLGIAVITGPVLLFTLESNLSLTVASVYGQILAIKLGLAGVMVAMGAYSQFVVQKKAVAIMASSSSSDGGDGATALYADRLRNAGKIFKAEAGVGIALLFMVSLMANGALPSGQFPAYEREELDAQTAFAEAPRTDFMRTLYTAEGTIKLDISPFAVGQNTFKLSFFDQDGSNATGIESATIKLTQLERAIGPITVETTEQSDNVFLADAAFSLPGIWHIEIEGVNTQGSNMLASPDLNIKPLISNIQFDTKIYNMSAANTSNNNNNNVLPLYPIFDMERQSIWVGDSLPGSGAIWQLDIATGNYTMHKINATHVTQSVLASDGSLWYIDPLGAENNGVVGLYNPADNSSSARYVIPEEGIPSGIAIDGNGNLWMPIVVGDGSDKVVKFDPASEQFSSYNIPTPDARPAGITSDRLGNIWFAEAGAGSIAKIDPATGNITEYKPKNSLQTLDEPVGVFADPDSSDIYISEHSGHTITVYNSLLGTFREYPSINEDGLPFGMAMDSYGNLWFAQHEIDKIGVIDPRTGEGAEANIPITGSFVQWITSDNEGRIWFAAQRGSALGSTTTTASPASPQTVSDEGQQQLQNGTSGPISPIQQLGFSFADVAGPIMAAGIVISALVYAKSVTDLKRNIRAALRLDR